jgi:phage-related minor tail protein
LPGFLPETVDKVRDSTRMLGVSTTVFAKAISKAFTDAAAGGKQFDDVLKQLALRLSGMAVTQAVNPIAKGMAGGLSKLFDGLFAGGGDSSESRRAIPFATGGVIGAPAYFPLSRGGFGLAGEAGPEAIVPLTRGSDGRLGVAMSGAGQPTNVTVWRELRHRAERQGVAADARVAQRLERRNRRGHCSRACGRSENPDCRYL